MEVYDLEILNDETIWFATDRGICIYDGYDFETLTQKDGLLHDCVLRLNKDPLGQIWSTGLDKRLCFFDGNRMKPYAWNAVIHQQIHPDTWIEDLAWDEAGNLIFMYAVNGRLFAYSIDQKSGEISEFQAWKSPTAQVYGQTSGQAFVNLGGQLIPNSPVTTCSGVGEKGQWIYYVRKDAPNQLSRISTRDTTQLEVREFPFKIITVAYSSDGALSLGTDNGLYHFRDGDMNSLPENAFPGIAIGRVFEDETGGFWLTTIEKGIFYLPSLGFRSNPHWNQILSDETVVTVQKGPAELFIATREGNLYALDTVGRLRRLLGIKNNLASVETVNVGSTSVFMGPYRLDRTGNGFAERRHIVTGFLAVSLELKDGTVFLAGYDGWEIRNAREDSILAQWSNKKMGRIQVLMEMPEQVLIGASNGLYAVDKESHAVSMVPANGAPFRHRVSDIELDKWGNCWVATLGNGLFCLRGSEVHHLGEAEGLRSTILNRIAFDDEGRLWMATNYGLGRLEYRFTDGKLEILGLKALSSLNGLPGNYVRDVSCWQGKIFIASDQGLHFFAPTLPDRELPVPKVRMKRVLVNDAPVETGVPLHFGGSVDHLELHFSAYSTLKSKQQPLFRCRLRDSAGDSTWTYTNARNQHFRDLGPGQYRFEVEACNARGEWAGQPMVLAFEIKRAWLQSLAIPLLLLAAALLAGMLVWRRRKRGAEAEPTDESPEPAPEPPGQGLQFNLEQQQLVLPSGQGYKVVKLREVQYVEANGSYVVLHLQGGKQHVLSQSLTAMEELLPKELFFRIHKSFLLNCEMVEGYESGRGGKIFLRDGGEVPIAVRRKAAFIKELKKKGLTKVTVHK